MHACVCISHNLFIILFKHALCAHAIDVAGSTDCKSGSHHINDDYKFIVEPSSKDIKLVNWAYNTESDQNSNLKA